MAKLEVLDGVASVDPDEWNALVGNGSPFLEWEWLASLEQAGTLGADRGWLPKPLVARDEGRLVAAVPLYVKGHSEGEFVFDWGWAEAAERAGLRYYPKLLVGVPFTPVSGARIVTAPGSDRPSRIEEMGHALRELCRGNEFSGVHVNFCGPDEIEPLRSAGFLLRVGVQYHWHNEGYRTFEDYLGRFRSKRRNQIRRVRRQLRESGVEIETRVGGEISDDLFDPMFRFYLSTIEARYWGRQYLNRRLFELIRERFRERLCFVIARCEGQPIAGTLNVQKGDALYGRYWGAEGFVRHLHFNVCYYAAIEHCIRAGLKRFEPGAGGDYKQLRGFDARPTYSLHWLADPRLSKAVSAFLERERDEASQTLDWLRQHSALKPAG
ncbi:MAG: GNAT family N-acetyltransferase [Myxococcota bacterium]